MTIIKKVHFIPNLRSIAQRSPMRERFPSNWDPSTLASTLCPGSVSISFLQEVWAFLLQGVLMAAWATLSSIALRLF